MQTVVGQLTTLVREATWIAPPFGMDQHIYSEEEKRAFADKPQVLEELRKANESGLNSIFGLYLQNHEIQNSMRETFTEQMKNKLKRNEWLQEKLIPQWGVGCRRLTPGIGYLETLAKPSVKVVFGEIESMTEMGCKCNDGKEYPVDILICATGFDTSFKPRFSLIGLRGRNLQDEWAKESRSYLGLAAPNMPNYMIFLGPNCPIGNGPVLSAIECQADYMLALCDRWQTENIHSFTPKKEAVTDFLAHTDNFMKQTIWQPDHGTRTTLPPLACPRCGRAARSIISRL
jgi:cation diffusion facilitator CzcD-associated flavoprotein CzcO